MRFYTDATERMRIDSSGRVLIGTTSASPADSYSNNLVVSEASGDGGISIHGNNSNSNYASLYFGDAGSGQRGFIETTLGANGNFTIGSAGTGPIRFTNGGVERLRIDGSGNVGIGITSPAFKLESNGGADDSVCFAGRSDGGNGNNARFTLKGFAHGGGANYGGGLKIQTRDTTNNFHDRLTVDSSGKVGIGTTSPQQPLHIHTASSSAANMVFSNTTTGSGASDGFVVGLDGAERGQIFNQENTDLLFGTNNTERMRIDSSGNVGIGTTAMNYPSGGGLTIYNATAPRLRLCNSSTGTGSGDGAEISIDNTTKDLYIENREAEDIIFYSAAERLKVTPYDGATFTGTGVSKWVCQFKQQHHAGFGTQIIGNSTANSEAFVVYSTSNNTTRFRVLWDGNCANVNNSFGSLSDISIKENIVDAKSQWDDIKAIKVRNFNLKNDPDTKMLGVVAQEIETVSPKLVWEDREGLKGVSYSVLYMKAIKALQEAIAKIETLETKVAALEAA